jgi:ABC-type uncharacterized transport system substrate-binding protein
MKKRLGLYFIIFSALLVLSHPLASSEPQLEQVLTNFCKVFEGVEKIGIIYSDPSLEKSFKALDAEAEKLKVTLIRKKVSSVKEVPETTRSLVKKVDTLWVVNDPIIKIPDAFNFLMLTAMQNRCKTIVPSRELLAKGGLFYSGGKDEIVVNSRIMKFMKVTLKEGSPKVIFFGEKE